MAKYYIVSGGFDPIHEGHIAMIKAGALVSDGVILLLNSDEWLKRKKGTNFMNFKTRKIICENLNNLNTNYFDKPLDVIMCNPPYFKINGKIKQNEKIAMCRHEITTNLQQIIFKSYQLLKNKGRVYIIIPADRMCEAINCFCQNGFEVKRIDIYNSNGNATICLFEAVKDAKSGVKIKVLKEGLGRS